MGYGPGLRARAMRRETKRVVSIDSIHARRDSRVGPVGAVVRASGVGKGDYIAFFFFSIVAIFFNSESIALFSGGPGTTVSTVARFELPTLTYFEPKLC